MRKFRYILILVVFVGVASCKKDKTSNGCTDLDMTQLINIVGGPYYTFLGERLITPAFNPNNDNEIKFVRERIGTSDKQIYVYNLLNHNKELIVW